MEADRYLCPELIEGLSLAVGRGPLSRYDLRWIIADEVADLVLY